MVKYVFVFLLSMNVSAQYNITISEIYPGIYKSLSDVIISGDTNCLVGNFQDVILYEDKFTYVLEYPSIGGTCPAGFGGCPDDLEPFLINNEELITCSVYGVIGLSFDQSNSKAIFDRDSMRLYLYNTEIWERLEFTGQTYPYVQMRLMDSLTFEVEEY